jgi:hypothetical protein
MFFEKNIEFYFCSWRRDGAVPKLIFFVSKISGPSPLIILSHHALLNLSVLTENKKIDVVVIY